MKPTIAIGDIHGHDSWKQVVNQNSNADRFIFVGDYFDSFSVPGLLQINNFKEIIEFKETSGKEVILLIGNHDLSYFPEIDDKGVSGYQAKFAWSIGHELNYRRKYLQAAYRLGNFVFTHAGLSSEWLDDNIPSWSGDNMVDKVNELFFHKPRMFKHCPSKYYTNINKRVHSYGYGDETFQSPLWIRPNSLIKANKETLCNEIIQVVGHTNEKQIDINGKSSEGRYYFIDTLPKEYLIIEEGQVKVGKLWKN